MPALPHSRAGARAAAVLLALAALVTSLVVASDASAATTSQLTAGQTLAANQMIVAPGGAYKLVMQSDGNLVLYNPSKPVWATGTSTGGSRLVMQSDGNAVVYTSSGVAVWNSHTAGSGATRMLLQDDGDLVLYDAQNVMKWHSGTAVAPTPVSIGAVAPMGAALTPYRYLKSANGAATAAFASDGSFQVSTAQRVLWRVAAGAQPGARFVLQPDGNVVMYSATSPIWGSGTKATNPGRLVMQDDGNLVAYTTTGQAIWATHTSLPKTPPPGIDRLFAGQQLVSGTAVFSKSNTYKLVQQSDGNLVFYGPTGAIWSTNSAGWPGSYSVLQGDGNFVTYSGTGQALWASRSMGAASLVVQGDGNLVAYTSTGKALWASKSSPKPPPLFPPQTTPPATAVSRYLRNLNGTGTDLSFMRSAGCSDARGVPNGDRYMTFLAFGAQASNVQGQWGVNLTASTGRITNGAVVAAVTSYIDGYRGCMQPYSALTVAVGTNNDGEDAGLGSTGGKIWADQVVDPIAAYAAPGGRVTVAGANDIEPGFAGNAAQAVSWMQGYLGSTSAPFVNTGSADGCPQTLGSTTSCNYGWTPRNLYDLTYGMMPTRALPLVQIYYTSMARQWANISLVGGTATGRRMTFAGPLTEVTACAQADSCYSMSSTDAWHTLWDQLKADPRTAISDLQYLTDLRIDAR